jgi:hypothetical protein
VIVARHPHSGGIKTKRKYPGRAHSYTLNVEQQATTFKLPVTIPQPFVYLLWSLVNLFRKAHSESYRIALLVCISSTRAFQNNIPFLRAKNLQKFHRPRCGPRQLYCAHYEHFQKHTKQYHPRSSFRIASRILSIRIRNEVDIGTTQTATLHTTETSIFSRHLCTASSLRDSADCEFTR